MAEETLLADSLKKACNKELTSFCKGVPPGQGRILACLYAFEDKVSDKCIYAVYDASVQLEQAVAAIKFAASQCKDDLAKFCAWAGEGAGLPQQEREGGEPDLQGRTEADRLEEVGRRTCTGSGG
jgi:hypothetical protein